MHYKQAEELRIFFELEFEEIIASIRPIETQPGLKAIETGRKVIDEHYNKAKTQFSRYETATSELYEQENPDNEDAMKCFEAFLNGVESLVELKKQAFIQECWYIAKLIQEIEAKAKAIVN